MAFIYGNGVMILRMSLGVEKLLPSDGLKYINEFRAIHINTRSNAHEYSLDQEFCLNFIISAGNINSLSNWLVSA